MSLASPFETDTPALGGQLSTSVRMVAPALRFAGFWLAVLLPFVLITMLVSGIAASYPTAVATLLALNLIGLALGRNYNS